MNGLAGLRIGLVGPLPPPAGGMAMQTRQLAELLQSAGAIVTVVQTNSPYRPGFLGRWMGVRAVARLLPYVMALWRAMGRCDVIHLMANSGWSWHLFATPALWIGVMRGVPVVVNYRGGEAADFLARSARVVQMSLRHAARLIVPSGFLKDVFSRHGMAAQVVPNIVNLERFFPGHDKPSAPQIVVARNLEPIYDNATALRAFSLVRAEFPAAMLTVAGSGPQAAELQALAVHLGVADGVTFCGRVGRDEMAKLLRRSHVALNPSLVDNMPNSVLEAMASGVPVVSTNVGGVPYIVRHGTTGLLVEPGNPEAMAAAVTRLLRDQDLTRQLADAAGHQVRQYTWDRVAPQLTAVYTESLRRA